MMNVFKIRRTKMLDDAVKDHKPQTSFTVMLIFYLVYVIGNFLSKVILIIPSGIWMISYDGFTGMIARYTASVISGKGDDTEYNQFMQEMAANTPSWVLLMSYVSFIGLIIAAVFYCKKFEKRPLCSLGIRKKSLFKEYGIGALIGACMISLTVLIALISGSVSLNFNPEGFKPMIILFIIGFIIQGLAEGTLFHGYFMMSIARDNKIAVAIGTSAVLFSLLSGGGEATTLSIINSVLFGIFLGVYVFKRGDIWGACAIHTLWNFFGGCIYGSVMDGINKLPTLFVMINNEKMHLANGGSVGIEGGVASTIILLFAVSLVFLLRTKKGEESLSDATDFEQTIHGSQN